MRGSSSRYHLQHWRLIAIAEHRGQGKTSSYILNEIEIARKLELPVILFAHSDVELANAPSLANFLVYGDNIVSIDINQIEDL